MSALRPGDTVSHFRIVERIGAGSSGEVYRAEDVHLNRSVALKLLLRCDDTAEQERILREARLCASLLHPNIAFVYEVGWAGTTPFLAMEFVEGEILSRRIREQKVSRAQTLKYMRQLLEALAEAHSKGVIHRDIKSSNIMITPKDQLKVHDFGIAGGEHTAEDPTRYL